jgi:hypothetical protein
LKIIKTIQTDCFFIPGGYKFFFPRRFFDYTSPRFLMSSDENHTATLGDAGAMEHEAEAPGHAAGGRSSMFPKETTHTWKQISAWVGTCARIFPESTA